MIDVAPEVKKDLNSTFVYLCKVISYFALQTLTSLLILLRVSSILPRVSTGVGANLLAVYVERLH